jgi:hypothetical protein
MNIAIGEHGRYAAGLGRLDAGGVEQDGRRLVFAKTAGSSAKTTMPRISGRRRCC